MSRRHSSLPAKLAAQPHTAAQRPASIVQPGQQAGWRQPPLARHWAGHRTLRMAMVQQISRKGCQSR